MRGSECGGEPCCNEGRLVMGHLLPALYVWVFSLLCTHIYAFAVLSGAEVRIHDFH